VSRGAALLALLALACGQDPASDVAPASAAPTTSAPPEGTASGNSTLQQAFALAEGSREGPDAQAGYLAARVLIQGAIDDQPDDARLHAALGHLWADEVAFRHLRGREREEHWAQARAAYLRALELEPDNVRAHAGLGDLALVLGIDDAVEQARLHFQRALEADPHDGHSRTQLAETLTLQGRLDEARAVLAATPTPPGPTAETAPEPSPDPVTVAPPHQAEGEPGPEPTVSEQPTQAPVDAQLEAWIQLADREADNAAVQRAVAIQCRQRGEHDCATRFEARANVLESREPPIGASEGN
jgi:Flp pilus assembly protein TadD